MRLDWPASSALARAVHANVIARTVKIYRYHRSSSAPAPRPAPPPSCVDSTQDRRQCEQLRERSAFADDGSQHRSPSRQFGSNSASSGSCCLQQGNLLGKFNYSVPIRNQDSRQFHSAIFMCFLFRQDVFFDRSGQSKYTSTVMIRPA